MVRRKAKSVSSSRQNSRPATSPQGRRNTVERRGRPRKAPGKKFVPTLITVEPRLLKQADAYAKKAGVSRSQLFSDAVRKKIGLGK